MGSTAAILKDTPLRAQVRLHHIRYPKTAHQSGDFAIAYFDVVKVIAGEIPDEFLSSEPVSIFKKTCKYTIAVTGKMPKLTEDVNYIIDGVLNIDKKWGPQYVLNTMRLDYDLSDPDDLFKFLSFFISEQKARDLVDSGSNPVEWLENRDLKSLQTIKGIGPATAMKMCDRYEECKDYGRAYVALKEFELTKRSIDYLVKFYGSADIAVEKILENPYILIKEVRGYGWTRADRIAQAQGLTRDCKQRVQAYIRFYLEEQANANGNSWVAVEDLLSNVAAECYPVTKQNLMDWAREMMGTPDSFDTYLDLYEKNKTATKRNEMPLLFYNPEDRKVGLMSLRLMEYDIAQKLATLRNAPKKFTYSRKVCQKIIKEVEAEQGFEYTDEQVRAIWKVLDNNVCVLTGSAGTGKSSTLAALVRIFHHYKVSVEQCALSGRASSLLSEITKVNGKTIHRLLCYDPESDRFAFNEERHLSAGVIVLDESSMVGGDLFLSLISAIEPGCKFLMMGDIKQLESIGCANILKDCLTSGYLPSIELTKIHRQASRSGIITQSLRASFGEAMVKPDFIGEEIRGELNDFKVISCLDQNLVQYNVVKEFKQLYVNQKIPLEDIQVIVPMRTRGLVSCVALNEIIQGIVNPIKTKKDQLVEFHDTSYPYTVCFKPLDRVIITHNNYHALGSDGKEKQIFNGNIGFIKDINNEEMIITLKQQGDIVLPRDSWTDVQLAYAITVHRKQGDSVPYAIVALDVSAYALFSKELVYTAITRASKFCTLVTQPSAINAAVKISRVKIKQTWLKTDLNTLYLKETEKKEFRI